jgi:hypothetical protein
MNCDNLIRIKTECKGKKNNLLTSQSSSKKYNQMAKILSSGYHIIKYVTLMRNKF